MDRTILDYFLRILGVPKLSKDTGGNNVLTVENGTSVVLPNAPSAAVPVAAGRDLTAADAGKVLTYAGAGAITLNLPAGLPAGFAVSIVQTGAGVVTVAAGAGAAVASLANQMKTAGQNACVEVRQTATDAYVLSGQTAV